MPTRPRVATNDRDEFEFLLGQTLIINSENTPEQIIDIVLCRVNVLKGRVIEDLY
jgi:hypothetical protein